MKRLLDRLLVGVAGITAVLVVVTSGVIQGSLAAPSLPVQESVAAIVNPGSAETDRNQPASDSPEPPPATPTGGSPGSADQTGATTESRASSGCTILASFTVGDPS
jgi:hypothetical protein